MGEAQELPQDVNGLEPEIEKTQENREIKKKSSTPFLSQYKWWIQMIIYSFFVLSGQAVGTLLGGVYFDKGGKSAWIATLVQVVGFPVLFPFQWIQKTNNNKQNPINNEEKQPFPMILVAVYVGLGFFLAANCMLYSIGLQNLPVTTYTLVCASQLGFNALFSYFLNKQKFTPYIVNSLVLLTISSILLVFQSDGPDDPNKKHKRNYVLGFSCTLGASAGYSLMLSVTQLVFKKIIKKENLKAVVDMTIYQSLVASLAIVIGLFASGDSRKLSEEMDKYGSGQVSYVMNLIWTAISWQVFTVGSIGLVFKVSSLFSNVIGILGLPLAPVAAVIFLHEKLTGLKAVSMLLAAWGFVSYMYQHYLDDLKVKENKGCDEEGVSQEIALVTEKV